MNSLLRREKKKGVGRRSSMVPPLLLGVSIPASFQLHTPLLRVSRNIRTVVTGLNPPSMFYEGRSVNHHAGDCLHLVSHLVDKHAYALQQPDYTDKATRLESFKYWDGLLPSLKLVDAGFHMIAPRDTVRCHWCDVVIANWGREDSPIDVHCLHRPNCDFVKNYIEQLSEVDGNRASCDESKAVGNLYGERLVINGGVKRGDSLINSVGPSTAQPMLGNISNSPQVVNLIAGINYPISYRSVATHGHEMKDSRRKSSEEILNSPPWEEIVFSERRCEDSIVNVQEDEVIVPEMMMMCKMCYVQKVDHVFLPCGDAKMCKGCAIQWYKSGRPCYFCDRLVATIHPVYL